MNPIVMEFTRSCIRHGEQEGFGMFQFEVFILEFLSVDRFTTCAIASRKIASLNHETLDDAMKAGPYSFLESEH